MVYNFVECNRDQVYLLPPALQEWLSPGDLVWLVIDAMEETDLTAFYLLLNFPKGMFLPVGV